MRLTAGEIQQAAGGTWIGSPSEAYVAQGLSTDTRTLQKGDLFVALRGERFDAHGFLNQAAAKGAGLIIAEDAGELKDVSVPVLLVEDSLKALGDLAIAWRKQCPAHRTAVVGSTGKTTTKELLLLVFTRTLAQGSEVQTLASRGNFNNRIGLPLTLFDLDAKHRWAILELGMNLPGELGRLTDIAAPDLLVFLNVGVAHIGQFGSLEKLKMAKAEALQHLPQGVPVLFDLDSENTRSIVSRYAGDRPRYSFGMDAQADYRACEVQPLPREGYHFSLRFPDATVPVHLPAFGIHNVRNATAAAAAAHLLGARPEDIVLALGDYRPSDMRGEPREIAGVTLIVDCYNANPDSMRSGLQSVKDWRTAGGRAFAVLGEMLELGASSAACHSDLAMETFQSGMDRVFLFGEMMQYFLKAWPGKPETAQLFERHEDLTRALVKNLKPGDVVFVKGSRGCKLEIVVQFLDNYLQSMASDTAF